MKKRILSLLLALMMVLSLIPTLAFAAGEDNSKVTVYFSLSDNGKYKKRHQRQNAGLCPGNGGVF